MEELQHYQINFVYRCLLLREQKYILAREISFLNQECTTIVCGWGTASDPGEVYDVIQISAVAPPESRNSPRCRRSSPMLDIDGRYWTVQLF